MKSAASKAETVASGVSGFAQHARSLVMNSGFNCVAPTNRNDNDLDDDEDDMNTNQDSEFDSNPIPQSTNVRGHSNSAIWKSKCRTANSINMV